MFEERTCNVGLGEADRGERCDVSGCLIALLTLGGEMAKAGAAGSAI